jgi:predicted ATP-grasp superfamily ATP-dependent carboligase
MEIGLDGALVQELIPGPETRIESYHAYVDTHGAIAGEFTGRKIRTLPATFGHSTAVEITQQEDLAKLGRGIVDRVGLRGVAKLDFKRGPDGTLHLLEINPRFTLWHHPGARAGVNLAALVYSDLVGSPRKPAVAARAGVRWCHPRLDAVAARDVGISRFRWLLWALGCEANSAGSWDDPMPLVYWTLRRLFRRRKAASIADVAPGRPAR